MSLCRAFTTTPDVAARLLSPAMRPLTRACLDTERAQRVVAEFKQVPKLTDEQRAQQADRWRENGDGAFFAELCHAAGFEQSAPDEL